MSYKKLHLFDGEMLTMPEIHEKVSCLSLYCIREHLKAGRNTRQAMTTFNSKAAIIAGGKKRAKQQPYFVI